MHAVHRSVSLAYVRRPRVLRWLGITAALTVVAILAQAVFAGRGLYINRSEIDVHGGLGNLTLALVIIQAALVIVAGLPGKARLLLPVASLALVALVVAQLALGYAGESSTTAAALHVPNGVLIFGLSAGIAAFSWTRQNVSRASTEASA